MALGQAFITFIDVAESSRRFFDAIVDILNEAFPDVDDKSGISLPGETGLVLKNNATFSEKLSFVENCLEGHEVFFNDLRNALEWVFEKMSPSGELSLPAYTWPGDDLTGLQIQFDTGKRTKFFDILMRACHRKSSRTMNKQP